MTNIIYNAMRNSNGLIVESKIKRKVIFFKIAFYDNKRLFFSANHSNEK